MKPILLKMFFFFNLSTLQWEMNVIGRTFMNRMHNPHFMFASLSYLQIYKYAFVWVPPAKP